MYVYCVESFAHIECSLVSVSSVKWGELLMPSAMCCPLWSSVYKCHKVECVLTFRVRTESGMFAMCCMQCCMCVSSVL